MIDLHTHSMLSDGELVPSELVRRAVEKGYRAIAITDHVDSSNIDLIVPRIVRVCGELDKKWGMRVIPGCELTHMPPKDIPRLVKDARGMGAKVIVVHGETIMEPVPEGTNEAAIESGIDILAHPGFLTEKCAELAKENGVYIEITARRSHALTNGHVAKTAKLKGAEMILNTDAHSPHDLIDLSMAEAVIMGSGLSISDARHILGNSRKSLKKFG